MNLQKLKNRQITDAEVKLLAEYYTNDETDHCSKIDLPYWKKIYSKNYEDLSNNENLTVFEYPKMQCVIVINLNIHEQVHKEEDSFVSLFTTSTVVIYNDKTVVDLTNQNHLPTRKEII
jgi:hypothetical protein